MKLTVNDWQDFSLKKDIEKLSNHVRRVNKFEAAAFFNIILALDTVILDKLFDST
ncbi:MAG: hypothetical protein LBH43_20680 [Treponema sp.]|jgi:hypothetical protein|nr:hypothetical protein [Treponema sp.]